MTITPWQLYLIMRLDAISNFGVFCIIAGFLIGGAWLIMVLEDPRKVVNKIILGVFILVIVFGVSITLLLTTTKQACIIFGVPDLLEPGAPEQAKELYDLAKRAPEAKVKQTEEAGK